jgi:predicted phosphate transport protein (TIGR00153 family)
MRLKLTPRDTAIIDLLVKAGQSLVEGAELLNSVVNADPQQRPALADAMHAAEHRSDEITHATMRRLNSTFVTPFDREDIYALASALDDCMDHMEEAADLVTLTRPARLPAGVQVQLSVLQRQSACTAAALPRLQDMRRLEEYWVEINRLENEADKVYRDMLAELFSGQTEVLEVLKVREVIDALESAADAFETVSHHVETIAVKES